MLKGQAQSGTKGSIANTLRRKRFEIVRQMIDAMDESAPILDVGGTDWYWESMGYHQSSHPIILLNTKVVPPRFSNMTCILGDGRDLSRFRDGEFQFVHSNSTLQYMTTLEAQQSMAKEIRRVGQSYYVQAPNYWFPLETHFLFPGFQWLPERLQVALLMRRSLGWYEKHRDVEQARTTVRSIRLVTQSEFTSMFSDAKILTEYFLGWPKSFVAYKPLAI